MSIDAPPQEQHARQTNPWLSLVTVCVGFFMVMVDSTVVAVATPVLMKDFDASVDLAVWVTSGYLLAYAAPLLVSGRLGDRFGPAKIYIVGLVIFVAASAACGMATSIHMLIAFRVVQGLGASLMTPQSMAVISRVFPAESRGAAMGVWGAVAGISLLVGPILGGLLIASGEWSWIFYINVPIGLVGLVCAIVFLPNLEGNHDAQFDVPGVLLSAVGLTGVVYGIENGESRGWDTLTWIAIAGGLALVGGFLWWQARTTSHPLMPLGIFKDRNFAISVVAIMLVGFVSTAMAFPIMLYAQNVHGLSPLQAALLLTPMALVAAGLSSTAGKLTDRRDPRFVVGFGMAAFAGGMVLLALLMKVEISPWWLCLPMAILGVGNAFLWSPIGTLAIRNLPISDSGAGSGVYNTARQVGGVLGGAAIAVFLARNLTSTSPVAYAHTVAWSLALPIVALLLGFVASMLYVPTAAVQNQEPS